MAFVVGTNNSETINVLDGVTFGDDDIYGYDGDDSIFGRGGDDHIRGGAGADALHGGPAPIRRSTTTPPSASWRA